MVEGPRRARSRARKKSDLLTGTALVVGDALFVFGSLIIAYMLYFHAQPLRPIFEFFVGSKGIPAFGQYLRIYPLATLVLLISFRYFGLYNRQWSLVVSSEFAKIARATLSGMVMLIILTFFFKRYAVKVVEGEEILVTVTYSTGVWVIALVSVVLIITSWRKAFSGFEVWYFKRKGLNKRLLLIGTNDRAEQVCRGIEKNPQLCYEIVGVVSTEDTPEKKALKGISVVGNISNFRDIIKQGEIDEIILCVTDLPHDLKSEIILHCEREMVDFRLVPDLFEVLTSNVEIVGIDGVPLMGLRAFPLDSSWNRFVKRIFDVVGSFIGLVLVSPVIAIASVFIKKSSHGAVFYKQVRCGEDGKEFILYKLRTMREGAEKTTGPVMASEDDPRKTPVGRFLRRYNLDELPQLYNVLKGDMSLVGPRPERPYFIQKFKHAIPRYMSRHHIKSGLTGWAQVHGLIQDTSLEQRIKYDLYYMENWSMFLDIKTILMTIITKKNGY